jgi:hypothetical protein
LRLYGQQAERSSNWRRLVTGKAVPDEISGLRYTLEAFLLGGDFELYEDERLIGTVAAEQVSSEISYGKLIFSCWGDGWSKAWRIVGGQVSGAGLSLECTRRMGLERSTLELKRGAGSDEQPKSRRDYCKKLAALVESTLAGIVVEHAVVARNDRKNMSGTYARLIMSHSGKSGESVIAGIGAAPSEHQTTVDRLLGAGLIWAERLRSIGRVVDGLYIFVPGRRALTLATRLTSIKQNKLKISLYEVDERGGSISPVEPFDQGDLAENFGKMARRAIWPDRQALPPQIQSLVESIVGIAPDFIESHVRAGSIVLSVRGLPFARVIIGRRRACFGLDGVERDLTGHNRGGLESLVSDVISLRTPWSDDRNSPIYRGYGERWLESLLLRDASAIDTTIDTRCVYSQVPIYRGEQRTFIDLLSATVSGRLVVMELKVSEDSDFPLQALDYWLKVGWHHQRGDFVRRGYFRDVNLSPLPPLLYLVAPLFRFHATTALVAGSISEQVPVYRIGINDDWRAGVRVLLRERLN